MKLTILKEFFAGFLRTRAMTRHFRRLALLDAFKSVTVTRDMPPALAQTLLAASRSETSTLFEQLRSHRDGLTETEAETIRDRVGLNEVQQEKPLPWWLHLWHSYKNPFNLLLTVLAGISWYTEDIKATFVISTMVVLSTLLRFVQESRSNRAADKLKEMVSNTATVLRRDPAPEAADEARRLMDVLCADKTGTLTQDKIFLERHTDVFGEESDTVFEYAYLNSYYQTGLKNLLDVAVLEHVEVHRELEVATAFRKVDEIPFDFVRRRMSVVVAEHDEHHLLICKGAVEEFLLLHERAARRRVEPLSPELLSRIREVTAALNEEGLRVVAVASKELPPAKEVYGVADESDLTLVGYIAFLDPPKESTAPALKALAAHGVAVKILTGDNELVTAKICREVGCQWTAYCSVTTWKP